MRVRKRPVEVDAHRWFRNGDHPDDGPVNMEGKVIRYYRHPDVDGTALHGELPNSQRPWCQYRMDHHGWIDTMEGGHTVCPGDWIITGVQGEERYPCEATIFAQSYEEVDW